MEIGGIPLHPLVVHAAVVFVPLAALLVLAYVVPRYRWIARWPALVVTALAALAVQVASMTGKDLEHRLGRSALVETHARWAGRLQFTMWVFLGLVLVAFWTLPHVTRLRDARDREARIAALEKPLMVLLPLLALAVLGLVVVTGDAGARAVWAGSGG